MDQHFIDRLDRVVAEVFDLMFEKLCMPSGSCGQTSQGLSASVYFSGSVVGRCTVRMEQVAAEEWTADLIGHGCEELSLLSVDTVGEICNIIAGAWKSGLDDVNSTCSLSSPSFTAGPILLHQNGSTRTLIRAYSSAGRCFGLELSLDEEARVLSSDALSRT